jgi:hypothetical protein
MVSCKLLQFHWLTNFIREADHERDRGNGIGEPKGLFLARQQLRDEHAVARQGRRLQPEFRRHLHVRTDGGDDERTPAAGG